MKKIKQIIAAFVMILSFHVHASAYHNLDLTLGRSYIGKLDETYTSIFASFEKQPQPIFLVLESNSYGFYDFLSVGGGTYRYITPYVSSYGILQYVGFKDDRDSIRITVGIKSMLTDRVMTDFKLKQDIFDKYSTPSYSMSLGYALGEKIGFTANYERIDSRLKILSVSLQMGF